MSKQDNIDTTQHLGEAINSGNLNAIHEVFAPNVIDRMQDRDRALGPAWRFAVNWCR